MTLVKQNPRSNNILDDFFFGFPTSWGRDVQNNSFSTPPVNIHETTDGYHVEFLLLVFGTCSLDHFIPIHPALLRPGNWCHGCA